VASLTGASIMRALLIAPLLAHKGRSALAVIAIALGVALGYAVQLINQVAIGEFSQAVQALSGRADLEIRGPRGGFDETLYPRIAGAKEVAVASPVIELEVRVHGRSASLRLVALDIFRAAQVQPDLVAAEGSEDLDFLRPDRIFLSQVAAEWLGAKAGDELTVQVGLGEARLRVAGVLRGESLRARLGVIDIAAAQAALDWQGRLNGIDIRLRPGVDADAYAQALRADLPPGLVIERPEANVARSASLSRAYRVNLNVLALVALFTGALLVFSTQALAVVRRRSQLALLRVLGVRRGQIVAMLLGEALVVGVTGAALGIVLGHVAAEVVIRYFGADLGAGHFRGLQPHIHIEPLALVLFALLGVATAVVGTLAAALEAAHTQPAQALKAGDEQQAFMRLKPVWPALLLLAAGAALTQAPAVDGLPLAGYVAIALLLLGAIGLMPRLAAICFGLLPDARSIPLRLAYAQLAGAPGQAQVSLAAIVASVSLMVSMAIMVTSFRVSLDQWLERVLPADLYLRTGLQNEAAFISPEEQERIGAARGVRRVEFIRSQQLQLAPDRPRVVLMARAFARLEAGTMLPLVGESTIPAAGEPPPVWITETIADVYGYRVGEIVTLPIAGRQARFTVAGVWRDYSRLQGALVIEREVYVGLSGDRRANDAALWLQPGASAEAVNAAIVSSVAGAEHLEIAQPVDIRKHSLSIFDRTFAVTYGLEAVAVVIGLIGLSSAFGALVLARRREFGMLRHIGVLRSQIGAMLAIEGALVSALGLAAGLGLGWVISLVLIHVVNRQSFHWSMELHLPWGALALFGALMLALSTLTALASGRRAMGEDAVRAVKDDW
jgi:putative ABC transport system permease protein